MSARKPLSPTFNGRNLRRNLLRVNTEIAAMADQHPDQVDTATLGRALDRQMKLMALLKNPPWRPLFEAAGDGRLARVKKLIEEQGWPVDTRNEGGYTPLAYAVSAGSVTLTRYLLDRGADINARTHDGLTPLSIAAAKNEAVLFRLLLEKGANPRTRCHGMTVRKLADNNSAHAVLAILDDRAYMARFAAADANVRRGMG